ncbi:MAG TPA: magnesium transporter [Elusimicrobiales bacterium]|nr:magnesium transporter [Elusimicrobiales bacterium]
MRKKGAAIELAKKFIQSDPFRAAQALETLSPHDAALVLKELPHSAAAQCLEHLPPLSAAQLLEKNSREDAAAILLRMDRHHAADTFRRLSQGFSRTVIPLLAGDFARDMGEILAYPKDTAGRIMHTEFLAFRSDMKVREVILKLRHIAKKHLPAAYCYVVDTSNSLLGVLNMRDLLLAPPDALVETVMIKEVARVSPFADKEELAAVFARRHYLAMPVVNETGRLIGVVSAKNIIASTEEEATEDLQILFGASAEERVHSPVLFKVRKRLPWLHINLATVFLAGAVVALFQDLISRLAVLAVFLPIVAGQGGNAGIQTLSVVLRGMIMREIEPKSAARVVLNEVWVGLINGLGTGLVTAFIVWLWKGNPYLGLVLGTAMVVNLLAAGLSGAIIPLTLKRIGFDPAQSSGIVITTITDVVGFFALLSTAWLLQGKLL